MPQPVVSGSHLCFDDAALLASVSDDCQCEVEIKL